MKVANSQATVSLLSAVAQEFADKEVRLAKPPFAFGAHARAGIFAQPFHIQFPQVEVQYLGRPLGAIHPRGIALKFLAIRIALVNTGDMHPDGWKGVGRPQPRSDPQVFDRSRDLARVEPRSSPSEIGRGIAGVDRLSAVEISQSILLASHRHVGARPVRPEDRIGALEPDGIVEILDRFVGLSKQEVHATPVAIGIREVAL